MSALPAAVSSRIQKPGIDAAESARRAEAVKQSAGQLRMEGMHASTHLSALEEQYVAGEIEIEDMIASVKSRHGM